EQAGIGGKSHLISQLWPDGQRAHTQRRITRMAEMNQIIQNRLCGVNWDGEADACALLRASGQDHGVDPDYLTVRIQEGASGVAGIDGGIGLDCFIDEAVLSANRANGADDAARHGAAEAEGIADGKYFCPTTRLLESPISAAGILLFGIWITARS